MLCQTIARAAFNRLLDAIVSLNGPSPQWLQGFLPERLLSGVWHPPTDYQYLSMCICVCVLWAWHKALLNPVWACTPLSVSQSVWWGVGASLCISRPDISWELHTVMSVSIKSHTALTLMNQVWNSVEYKLNSLAFREFHSAVVGGEVRSVLLIGGVVKHVIVCVISAMFNFY